MTTDAVKRGLALRQRRQLKKAIACFQEAVAAAPEDPLGWYYLAVTHDNRGQEAEAIPNYRRALELGLDGDRRANAWAWLGSSLRITGQPKEALECFAKAESMGYPQAKVLGFRGLALIALGRHAEALVAFDKAIRLEPEAPDYWRGRVRSLRHLGRRAEAALAMTQAKRLAKVRR